MTTFKPIKVAWLAIWPNSWDVTIREEAREQVSVSVYKRVWDVARISHWEETRFQLVGEVHEEVLKQIEDQSK